VNGRLMSALLAANVLLLVALALVWQFGAFNWNVPEPIPADASLLGSVAGEPVPVPDYERDNVLGRPLFMADRRPFPVEVVSRPAPEPVAPPVDDLAGVRVLGLVGDGAGALVIIQRDGKTARLPVGAVLGAWRLTTADMLGADFVSSTGESRRITIQRGGMASVGAATPDGASAPAQAAPGSPQARAAERRARREALLRQAQERNR